MSSRNSDVVADLVKAAKKQGWTVKDAGRSWRFVPLSPDGPIVFVPKQLVEWKGIRNVRGKLRRNGLDV